MKKYYYIRNGQQLGPFTYDELWNQKIEANTMVWYEGMSEWKPASAFTEFGNWFAQTQNPKKQRGEQLQGQQRRQVQQRSQHAYRPKPVKKKKPYRAIIGILIFLIGCFLIYSYWFKSGGQTPEGSQREVTRDQGKSHITKKSLQAQLPDQENDINLNTADYPSSSSGLGGSKDEKVKEAIIPEFALVTTAEDLYFGTPQDSDEMRSNLENLLVFKAKDEEMADEFVPILEKIHANTDFVANDEVYIITSGDADENLGGLVYITKKLSPEQLEEATEFNVGAAYLTAEGPVFEPGYFNEEDGTVTVATHHFSAWKWLVNKIFGTPETSIDQVIQQEAYKAAEALGSGVEDKLIKSIESSIEQLNLNNTAKTKILSAVMNNREEIGNIAAAQEDPAKASQSVALMLGKIIVDNIDEDDLGKLKFGNSLKMLTEKSELVGNAATELGSGNYWKIVELVAKDYTDNNMITKVVTTAAKGVDLTIKVWEDKKVNQIYKEWSEAPDKNEYWKDVAYKGGYDVYFRQVRLKGLKGCADYDDGSAERCLEKVFQNRVKKEEATAYEAKKIKALYEIYSRENRTTTRVNFYDQQKAETGQKIISKNDQFRFFLKKMNEIQRDLQSIGKGGDGAWNKIKISEEAKKLMYAYGKGGKKLYRKQMNEFKSEMNKDIDVSTPLESNSKTPKTKKADNSGIYTDGEREYQASELNIKEIPGAEIRKMIYKVNGIYYGHCKTESNIKIQKFEIQLGVDPGNIEGKLGLANLNQFAGAKTIPLSEETIEKMRKKMPGLPEERIPKTGTIYFHAWARYKSFDPVSGRIWGEIEGESSVYQTYNPKADFKGFLEARLNNGIITGTIKFKMGNKDYSFPFTAKQ